jgi:hypothetical protein
MLIKARFRFSEIFFGMLLAVAIFAIGLAVSPSIFSPNQSAENSATTEKPDEKSKKVGKSESADDRIAKYTLWLAILTGGLVIVSVFQGVMLLRSDKTARIAAEAAKKSADAVVSAELPILILHFVNLAAPGIASIAPNTPLPEKFKPIISFENYGRGPAQIVSGCLEWTLAKDPSELPLPPKYQNIVPYTANAVVLQNRRIPIDAPCEIELTSDQIVSLNTHEQFLWVYGYIAYRDFLDRAHEARFCIKWVPHREGHSGSVGFVWETETPPEYTKRS